MLPIFDERNLNKYSTVYLCLGVLSGPIKIALLYFNGFAICGFYPMLNWIAIAEIIVQLLGNIVMFFYFIWLRPSWLILPVLFLSAFAFSVSLNDESSYSISDWRVQFFSLLNIIQTSTCLAFLVRLKRTKAS